ncbi:hypothetical protein MXB_1549 [Myxobolus squamalis]|nr:hypothetical protein MXB_1549 [Myxobolus squamalis]
MSESSTFFETIFFSFLHRILMIIVVISYWIYNFLAWIHGFIHKHSSNKESEYTLTNCVVVLSIRLDSKNTDKMRILIRNILKIGAKHIFIYDPHPKCTPLKFTEFNMKICPFDNQSNEFCSNKCTFVSNDGLVDFSNALSALNLKNKKKVDCLTFENKSSINVHNTTDHAEEIKKYITGIQNNISEQFNMNVERAKILALKGILLKQDMVLGEISYITKKVLAHYKGNANLLNERAKRSHFRKLELLLKTPTHEIARIFSLKKQNFGR